MAIKTKEELLEAFKGFMGENQTDVNIAFMEDIADTFADLTTKANDNTEWKTKYEENDKMWKQKYTDRFLSGEDTVLTQNTVVENSVPENEITIEDLFK